MRVWTRGTPSFRLISPPEPQPEPLNLILVLSNIYTLPRMLQGLQIHGQSPLLVTVPKVSLSRLPLANVQSAQTEILTEPALAFLAALHRTFNPTRLSVRFGAPYPPTHIISRQTDVVLRVCSSLTPAMPSSSVSTRGNNSTFRRRPHTSALILPGYAHHLRPAWKTAGSKSLAPPTARWSSMP